jgi:hypothetical protein
MQNTNLKLKLILPAILTCAFFALAASAYAATYYVDANLSAGHYSVANSVCNGLNITVDSSLVWIRGNGAPAQNRRA